MTMHPPISGLDQLVEPLTAGEHRVALALASLEPGWIVYVKPRTGLDRPDFIAMHDVHGVCTIEVIDWEPGSTRRTDDGEIERLGDDGAWTTTRSDSRFYASRTRSSIFDQFYALPEHGGTPTSTIRGAIIVPAFTNAGARQLFAPAPSDDPESLVNVHGGDDLESAIRDIVVGLGCPVPPGPSMSKLRRHIVASERVVEDVAPSWMSDGVRNLAENPDGLKARRVRGPAGSGKSFGLTARAARLAADGKRVLILTLNITLANRLRSMANERCRETGANPTLIACSNFHSFCTRVVQDAEMAGLQLTAPRGAPWTVGIVAKTEQALDLGFAAPYDAILIDEGQDFTIEWWNLLRTKVLTPGGEMLAVADPTQDIYDRYSWAADETIAGAEFSGGWTDLLESHRMPNDLLALTNEFARDHLDGEHLQGLSAQTCADPDATDAHSVRNWIDIDRLPLLGRTVGTEVVRLLRDNPGLKPGDIAFICDYHHDGVAAVRVIEAAGYPVHHIFSRDPDAPRRRRKHRFWPDADAIKGCTAHSLKGWEMPVLVMGIGVDDRAKRLAYVAMTRVATRPGGAPSYVSVVSADAELIEFGQKFVAGSSAPAAVAPATPPAHATPAVPATPLGLAAPMHAPQAAPAASLAPPPAPVVAPTSAPTPASAPVPASAPGAVRSTRRSADDPDAFPLDTSALAKFTALLESAIANPAVLGLSDPGVPPNPAAHGIDNMVVVQPAHEQLLDAVAAG
jgi:AAA domain